MCLSLVPVCIIYKPSNRDAALYRQKYKVKQDSLMNIHRLWVSEQPRLAVIYMDEHTETCVLQNQR